MAMATLHANGRVNVTLPNLSIITERREAETLRDQLNAILPQPAAAAVARERDLMLEPSIRDIDVLRAAQAIAAEHECHSVVRQIGNMIELYCHEDAQRDMTPAERDGGEQRDSPWKLHLLSIMGDVEPVLSGPFEDERDRVEAAQDYRRAHGDEDGLYRIDATGDVKVSTFAGNELPDHPRRCALCRCDATEAKYGFPVCAYHYQHGEDDPPCPACTGGDAEQLEDGRQILSELRDMPRTERETRVAVGDRVRDPMDNGRWRTVTRIEGTTVFMADGGCMGIDECREIRLPSEALD